MFEQTFVTPGRTRRDRTIVIALGLQAVAVTGIALLPLLQVQPIEIGKRFLILPPSAIKPEPVEKLKPAQHANSPAVPRRAVIPSAATHAVSIPRILALDPGEAPALIGGPATSGSTGGLPGGIGEIAPSAPLPTRQPQPKPSPKPVRLSSSVTQSKLIFGPKPAYPKLAVTARVEGTVRLQATINRQGLIENLHVLSGHPLLVGPAMEAVRAWRYHPVILNGDPVEVITEIDVNFTLRD